jgi:hypothetical protein
MAPAFADQYGQECLDCLAELKRAGGVAQGYCIKCFTCGHGVKISNGKRKIEVKYEPNLAGDKV